MNIQIDCIPALKDNYIFCVSLLKKTIVIDPGELRPVLDFLKQKRLQLCAILNTHHHEDHTAAIAKLREIYECPVLGPKETKEVDTVLNGGDQFQLCQSNWRVFACPGHTKGHLCYYHVETNSLFSGDVLFSAGCGRLFEGTAQDLANSLQQFYQLNDDCAVYCAHEYTLSNLKFALHIDPKNPEILKAFEEARLDSFHMRPSIPSSIAKEKKINLFFKLCETPNPKSIAALQKLRAQKDVF